MGRSVNYLTYAQKVAYFDVSTEDENDEWTWDDFIGNITFTLKSKLPSLEDTNEWDGNEVRIFLKNRLIEIGVSEYCGLASVSVRTNQSNWEYENLALNFIEKTWDNLVKAMAKNTYHDCLTKVGTFSNGESVYQRV